jgi:hypothetical protein
MKTLDDCLDDLLDDEYVVTETLLEFVDADVAESLLRAIYNAYKLGDGQSVGIFAKSLASELDEKLKDRASKLKTPTTITREDYADYARTV